MGIIDFLGKQKDEPRLHEIRLPAEEDKPRPLFDPEKEISETDWEEIKQDFRNQNVGSSSSLVVSRLAFLIKLLFPGRFGELDIDDEFREGLKKQFDLDSKYNDWQAYIIRGMRLKILFPERAHEIKMDDAAWDAIKIELEGIRSEERWAIFAEYVIGIKVLAPDRFRELNLNEVWPEMKQQLDRDRINNTCDFVDLAAKMKILFPERVRELGIDDLMWQSMKEKLSEEKVGLIQWIGGIRLIGLPDNFIKMAVNMKILAAHKVQIGSDGIEIIMNPPQTDFHDRIPQRPVRKMF